MKHTTLLLTIILWTVKAFADCAISGLYFWPSGQTIKQNSIIVIDGYNVSQDVINGLNNKYPIYLKSGDKKVKLTVKEILVGEYKLTQAILTVDEILEAGKEYELHIDNFQGYEGSLRRRNPITNENEKVKWTVVDGIDAVCATWTKKPVETQKTLVYWGCGPEIFVDFYFKIEDQSEFLIKTTITNKKTKNQTSYYLKPIDKNKVKVGHSMCSGAFLFKEGDEYDVSFDIMDASGNLTLWNETKILFSKPVDENSIFEY